MEVALFQQSWKGLLSIYVFLSAAIRNLGIQRGVGQGWSGVCCRAWGGVGWADSLTGGLSLIGGKGEKMCQGCQRKGFF